MRLFFFLYVTSTTEVYTLSLHDALPICSRKRDWIPHTRPFVTAGTFSASALRTSRTAESAVSQKIGRAHVELQSQSNLVCRLLLEKKKYRSRSGSRSVYLHRI